jgi:hypothetical protein
MQAQPARNHEKLWRLWKRDQGDELKAAVESLEQELRALQACIVRTQRHKAREEKDALQKLVESLPKRAETLRQEIESKRELIDLVLLLAEKMNGDLFSEFRPILGIPNRHADLEARRAYAEEKGIEVPELGECPAAPKDLRKAIEKLLGGKVDVPGRSLKWRRVGNQIRGRRLDREAKKAAASG